MAAHRYWRCLFQGNSANSYRIELKTLEFRASIGGASIASGGTALSSGTTSGATANLYDGNTATVWQSNAPSDTQVWAGYDFGSAVTVAEVSAVLSATTGLHPPWGWVQVSDNGSTWEYAFPAWDIGTQSASATVTFSGFAEGSPAAPRVAGKHISLGDLWPSGPVIQRVAGRLARFDFYDGGAYRVAGTLAIDGTPPTPVRRRVRLFERISGRLVREQWSATDGTFLFNKIVAGEYIVMADDYTRAYNAVVADAVVAVP